MVKPVQPRASKRSAPAKPGPASHGPDALPAGTWLGIDGGGTRTVALLVRNGHPPARIETGPGNLRLLDDATLTRRFREIHNALGKPRVSGLGIGLAGTRTESDRQRIRTAAAILWPGVPCLATHDLHTALTAGRGLQGSEAATCHVLVLSGTGSCAFGRSTDGREARSGGWGHQLGDRGSAYDTAMRALRRVIECTDHTGTWPALGSRILRHIGLNEPEALIGWAANAPKHEVASLAVEVVAAWDSGDPLAAQVIKGTIQHLVDDARTVARRLAGPRPRAHARSPAFLLSGGMLDGSGRLRKAVTKGLRSTWPKAIVERSHQENAWGAVRLAALQFSGRSEPQTALPPRIKDPLQEWIPESTQPSPTERRNPRSMRLDRMPLKQAVELMVTEERWVMRALRSRVRELARGVDWVAQALNAGGRIIYVGAGTSGRLGVLDASECPPTFRSKPDQVQAVIAGGRNAMFAAVEGAEDNLQAGAGAMNGRGVNAADVVVGIAASGRTPFVWGALAAARHRGARTILVSCNPHLKFRPGKAPDLSIALNTGPEVLTGSTRLKAGTATKVVLNLLTTLGYARTGKVVQNLMIDVHPSNAKLQDRAVRILQELTGRSPDLLRSELAKRAWQVKKTWEALSRARQ